MSKGSLGKRDEHGFNNLLKFYSGVISRKGQPCNYLSISTRDMPKNIQVFMVGMTRTNRIKLVTPDFYVLT